MKSTKFQRRLSRMSWKCSPIRRIKQLMMLISLLSILSVSTMLRAETIELKSLDELKVVWSIPVESCVQQAIVDDSGDEPYVKAIRSGYFIRYYDKSRKVVQEIRTSVFLDSKPDSYTREDWDRQNCPDAAFLSPNGDYYWISEDEYGNGKLVSRDGKEISRTGTMVVGDTVISSGAREVPSKWLLSDLSGKKKAELDWEFDIPVLVCKDKLLFAERTWPTSVYNLDGKLIFRTAKFSAADISDDCSVIVGALVTNPGMVCILDGTGKERYRIPLPTTTINAGVKISPDGSHAAVFTVSEAYYVDTDKGNIQWKIPCEPSGTHHWNRSYSVAISSDNKYVGFKAIMPGRTRGERLIVNDRGEIVFRYPTGYDGSSVFELLQKGRYILMDDYKSLKLFENPAYSGGKQP